MHNSMDTHFVMLLVSCIGIHSNPLFLHLVVHSNVLSDGVGTRLSPKDEEESPIEYIRLYITREDGRLD